ncbi:hypothetical protein PRIPAC_86098 [Pristionchus pacificus]|uniref:Cytochrome P450 n=1 Tax=Pristionchus pacificus TaxID=54126 RepID=A0A2A6BLU7_PRIPA|nr:hypothetical protein PRIPAC_86098 [Pristionchus pacificus]|eukprot:PDM66877.1 cytochrome P450 [Pristionchus pacificus]
MFSCFPNLFLNSVPRYEHELLLNSLLNQIHPYSVMIILLVTLAIVGILCYSLFINRIKGLPPGPPPLPLLGNFHQFEADLDKKFFEWKRKYGKAFTVWMPNPTVVITDYKI